MADKVKPSNSSTTRPPEKGLSTNGRLRPNSESVKSTDRKPSTSGTTDKKDKK